MRYVYEPRQDRVSAGRVMTSRHGGAGWRIILMPLVLVMSAMVLPVAKSADVPSGIERILKARKLVVSMHAEDAVPFFMVDKSGRLYGLEIELMFDLARKLGVDVCFQRDRKTYDEIVQSVEKREADVGVSVLSRTTKRAISVSFSDPYVVLHHALLLNRNKTEKLSGGKKLAEWLSSSGLAIGVVKGSSYVEFAQRDYPSAQLVQFVSFDAAAQAVLKGEIHAALYDDAAVQDWISEHPEAALYIQMQIRQDREDPIAIAVNCEDTHLLQWINVYIDTIRKDGTLDKLVSTYLKGNVWKEPSIE